MAIYKERLNRGFVNIKDPAELAPGELSAGRNYTYFPGDPAIYRSTGRDVFGTATAAAGDVSGLRDMTFDNGDKYLIAMVTGATQAKYRIAPVGDTGTFTDLATISPAGSTLDVVHFRNRFYLFNGATQALSATAVNSNLVVYLSATTAATAPSVRQHGMLAVVATPTVTTASAASGSFPQTAPGYYEYWTTETTKYVQDGTEQAVESTFAGSPATVYVSATTVIPVVSMPAPVNSFATHWSVYRSTKKDSATDKRFPTGFKISSDLTMPTGTASATFSDTLVVASASAFSTLYNTGSLLYSGASNPSNMNADDTSYATLAGASQGAYAYDFGGFRGSIRGIKVEMEAFISVGSAPAPLVVTIGARRQSDTGDFGNLDTGNRFAGGVPGALDRVGHTAAKSQLVTATSAGTVLTFGGDSDRWYATKYPGLSDSHLNEVGGFMVVVRSSKAATTISIDYIKVTVYYGASVDGVIPFPTVVYTFGDISSQVGKNGPPFPADTGDVYEDTLVTNDKGNPAFIRYSYPGDPEAFPATYYVDFDTQDNDRIQLIKVVNDRLVVALTNSAWRMNYLPSERDASFDRGKSKAPISRSFGCVSPMCGCVFTRPNGGEELAMVSNKGVWSTDGFGFAWRSGDNEWRTTISLTSTSNPICLINDAENLKLGLFYRNDAGGNDSYFRLDLHYDIDSIKEGGSFRMSGPTFMRNYESGGATFAELKSAWAVPRVNGDTSLYFGYGGTSVTAGAGMVYLNTGTTIPSFTSTMSATTRRIFLGGEGEGNEWRLTGLHGYCGSFTGSPVVTYSMLNVKSDGGAEYTAETKIKTLGVQKFHRTNPNAMLEGARIGITIASASAFRQEFIVLETDDLGREDSGA